MLFNQKLIEAWFYLTLPLKIGTFQKTKAMLSHNNCKENLKCKKLRASRRGKIDFDRWWWFNIGIHSRNLFHIFYFLQQSKTPEFTMLIKFQGCVMFFFGIGNISMSVVNDWVEHQTLQTTTRTKTCQLRDDSRFQRLSQSFVYGRVEHLWLIFLKWNYLDISGGNKRRLNKNMQVLN